MEFKLIDIQRTKTENVRILIAQLEFDEKCLIKKKDLFYHNDPSLVKNNISGVLKKSLTFSCNLIVFAELAIPAELHVFLQKFSQENRISIIAGSYYYSDDGSTISRSPIILDGTIYFTDKLNPSPYELSPINENGLQSGQTINIFKNTIIGDFSVLICADYLNEEIRTEVLRHNLDFLIVIAFQNDSGDYYRRLNSNCEDSEKGCYFIYCNSQMPPLGDGRSAIFAHVDRLFLEKIQANGLTDNEPDKKIFELENKKNGNSIIAEFDLENKKPSFARNYNTTPNINFYGIHKQSDEIISFLKLIGQSDLKYDEIENIYVNPNEYNSIKQKLDTYNLVFIIGDPGIGKTYSAVRLLKEFFKEGYKPIWFTGLEAEDRKQQRMVIENYQIPKKSIVYFEDPFGRTQFERRDSLFTFLGPIISKATKTGSKIVITSRREIFDKFSEESLSREELNRFKEELNVIRPSYSKESLTQIAKNHVEYLNIEINDSALEVIINSIDKNQVQTPFEIRELLFFANGVNDPKAIYDLVGRTKLDSIKTFAFELANSEFASQLLYILIFLFGNRKNATIDKIYDIYMQEHLSSSPNIGYRNILKKHLGYRIERYGILNELVRFSHPRYEEALVHLIANQRSVFQIVENILKILNTGLIGKNINPLRVIHRITYKYPTIALSLFNLHNEHESEDNLVQLSQFGNKLISAHIDKISRIPELSEKFKSTILNGINVEEILSIVNSTNNLYVIYESLRFVSRYYRFILNRNSNELQNNLNYPNLFKAINQYKSAELVVDFIDFIQSWIDEEIMSKFALSNGKISVMKIIAKLNTSTRLKLLSGLSSYENIGELLKFSSKLGNKVEWKSQLRLLLESAEDDNVIVIDDGACEAVLYRFANLLSPGIVSVQGNFQRDEAVNIVNERNELIAKGLTQYSSRELKLIKGQHSSNIIGLLNDFNGINVVKKENRIKAKNEKRWLTIDKK